MRGAGGLGAGGRASCAFARAAPYLQRQAREDGLRGRRHSHGSSRHPVLPHRAVSAAPGIPRYRREKVIPEATAWFTGEALMEFEVGWVAAGLRRWQLEAAAGGSWVVAGVAARLHSAVFQVQGQEQEGVLGAQA